MVESVSSITAGPVSVSPGCRLARWMIGQFATLADSNQTGRAVAARPPPRLRSMKSRAGSGLQRRHPQIDQLDRLAGKREAVLPGMGLGEAVHQRLPAGRIHLALGKLHFELVVLAGIAHIGRAADLRRRHIDAAPQLLDGAEAQALERLGQGGDIDIVGLGEERLHAIDPGLGDGRTEGRAEAGMGRHDHAGHAQALGDGTGMERPGAAKGDEGEVADIEAALHRDQADGIGHVLIHRADDGERRVLGREGEGLAQPGKRRPRGREVQGHGPAQEEGRDRDGPAPDWHR